MQHRRFRLPVRWLFLMALALGLGGLWQHQTIHDWLSLYNYAPPSSVVQLADETRMSSQARRLFYINHPVIEDRNSFNASCSARGEHTIVLGCYHPVDRGIYIFQISDPRLTGVDQVTAAHEMLHAAYDRLSARQRASVDRMLQDYYTHDLKDDRIIAIVAAYQKTEPSDVVDEMHSIFGTEMADLPSGLEQYYKQYFEDRSKVVGYANAYQEEFTTRQSLVTNYDNQLQTMKQQIAANTAQLDAQEAEIATFRRQLNNERTSGNVETYNGDVPLYNAKIDSYNSAINATKDIITRYNKMVNERNDLVLQVADLAHSIDSNFNPISQ